MSPKAETNNRITTKLVKTTNQLKPTTEANSPIPLASASGSGSASLPLTSSLSSSTSLEQVAAIKEVLKAATAVPLPTAVTSKTIEAISEKKAMPTPTKIDPYSILSFASASSTSVSMARMSVMKEGIMSYHNVIAMLTLLFLFCGLASVDGLKCYMCGQYNEGVGSITPCLNYSEQYAHLYLKDCPKSTEKFCVKYVSELSTVRDCATECAEKEIWETKTYCCNTDGCNGAGNIEVSLSLILLPVLYIIYKVIKSMTQNRH